MPGQFVDASAHVAMIRLFAALVPPAQIRAQLIDIMGGIAGARWQDDAQLHLTLRFMGMVDTSVAEDIAAALDAVIAPVITLRLSGLGVFDKGGFAHTLWAGVAPHAPVRALHDKIDQALMRAGIAPDARAFAPHITLARMNRGTGPVGPFLASHGALSSTPFLVTHFALFESTLGHGGAHYACVARYPLVGPDQR